MNISKIFPGIHTEGKYSGTPSIFVEFSETDGIENPIEVFNSVRQSYPRIKNVVLLGDVDPLLYRKELETFLSDIYFDGMVITIVTDGSQPILNPLHRNIRVDLYIIKPNMDNPKPQSYVDIVMSARDYQFVFESTEDCEKKIDVLYTKMAVAVENMTNGDYLRSYYFNNHPNKHTLIIEKNQQECKEICLKRGWGCLRD
jgi:organic radical activating enzyme